MPTPASGPSTSSKWTSPTAFIVCGSTPTTSPSSASCSLLCRARNLWSPSHWHYRWAGKSHPPISAPLRKLRWTSQTKPSAPAILSHTVSIVSPTLHHPRRIPALSPSPPMTGTRSLNPRAGADAAVVSPPPLWAVSTSLSTMPLVSPKVAPCAANVFAASSSQQSTPSSDRWPQPTVHAAKNRSLSRSSRKVTAVGPHVKSSSDGSSTPSAKPSLFRPIASPASTTSLPRSHLPRNASPW